MDAVQQISPLCSRNKAGPDCQDKRLTKAENKNTCEMERNTSYFYEVSSPVFMFLIHVVFIWTKKTTLPQMDFNKTTFLAYYIALLSHWCIKLALNLTSYQFKLKSVPLSIGRCYSLIHFTVSLQNFKMC